VIIAKAEIANFRALQSISVPLDNLSILLGENDAGKTSFLHALDTFFVGKKLSDETDWFKHDPSNRMRMTAYNPKQTSSVPLLDHAHPSHCD
jgi:predicted ATP-dependent endonuclease of OLD family